jgi:hypothetical protein
MDESSKQKSIAATGPVSGHTRALMPDRLDTLEELLLAVHELLADQRLEVRVVTPLLYSLLETYIDNFQAYPFGDVSKLLTQLEVDGYPEPEIHALMKRIEDTYEQYHANSTRQTVPGMAMDSEYEGLRQSIKYAAMVADQED